MTFEQDIQRKAEEHLERCMEAMDASDSGQEVESPAYAPFDGCQTCIVREILTVCWDEMWEEIERRVAAQRTDAPVPLDRARNALRAVPRTGHD